MKPSTKNARSKDELKSASERKSDFEFKVRKIRTLVNNPKENSSNSAVLDLIEFKEANAQRKNELSNFDNWANWDNWGNWNNWGNY